jgi:putative ABC transport system permease protein
MMMMMSSGRVRTNSNAHRCRGFGGDIKLQFLIEAITLSLFGGLIGVLVGLGISKLVGTFASFQAVVSFGSILLAFGVSFAIGVFFGFYPARKAAALDPIDALRYE